MRAQTLGPIALVADGLVVGMKEDGLSPHEHSPVGMGVGLLVRWVGSSGAFEDCILTAEVGSSAYTAMTGCRPGDIVHFEGEAMVMRLPGLLNDTALLHRPRNFRIARSATPTWRDIPTSRRP